MDIFICPTALHPSVGITITGKLRYLTTFPTTMISAITGVICGKLSMPIPRKRRKVKSGKNLRNPHRQSGSSGKIFTSINPWNTTDAVIELQNWKRCERWNKWRGKSLWKISQIYRWHSSSTFFDSYFIFFWLCP